MGIASQTQESQTTSNIRRLLFLATASIPDPEPVCGILVPADGIRDVFSPPNDLGPNSDLIVSEGSQEALGLGVSASSPPNDKFPNIIHSVDAFLFNPGPDALSRNIVQGEIVGVQTDNPQRAIDLLNEPVTSSAFGPILP